MLKKILIWIFAVIITVSAAIYQKMTGPTYPKKVKTEIKDREYTFKLLRSHGGDDDAKIKLDIEDQNISAQIFFRPYPADKDDKWYIDDFRREQVKQKSVLVTELAHLPPAGKYEYYIVLKKEDIRKEILKEKPVVIRFKGGVPMYILIPHIFFIFFAMLFANASGLFALWELPQYRLYTNITFVLLILGGMILGPIVQKFAFGDFWTGVPFGWDLTDNKMLIGFLAWAVAFFMNLKKENKTAVIIATLIILIIFSIPHSMFGSELNRETGEITQGFIKAIIR